MLADSVESAMRALQDPTPERIRSLIEGLVDAKIADRQLDESPLTLREIRQIKEQFIKVLSGIHHHRIDYPQTRHLTEAPETSPKSERGLLVHGERPRTAARRIGDGASTREEAAARDEAVPTEDRELKPGGGESHPRKRGSGR